VLGEVVAAAVAVGEHSIAIGLAAAIQLNRLFRTIEYLPARLARRGFQTGGHLPRLLFAWTPRNANEASHRQIDFGRLAGHASRLHRQHWRPRAIDKAAKDPIP